VQLTVKPLKQKDAGRGLVALDRTVADELDVEGGDYVRLSGTDGVVARVWPGYPEDAGRDVVRVDGHVRRLLGVSVDDRVTVEPADVRPAGSLTVSLDAEEDVEVNDDFRRFVRQRLAGTPVVEGQRVSVEVGLGSGETGGERLPLEVVRAEPDGVVVVTEQTSVSLDDRARAAPDAVAAGAGVAYLPASADGDDSDPDADDGDEGPGETEADADAEAEGYRPTVRRRLRENTLLLGVIALLLLAAAVPLVALALAEATPYSFATWATAITGVVSVLGIGARLLLQQSD
jgi:hypothetical protein